MSTSLFFTASVFLLVLVSSIPARPHADSAAFTALRKINVIRTDHRLQALRLESTAADTAEKHASELASRMTLSHRSSDGMRVNQRYRLEGGTALRSGENLGAGDDVDVIIQAWMDSPSHRANLLNPDWFNAGIGSCALPGGRILLVAVFTGSRWKQKTTMVRNDEIILSGSIVLRIDVIPDEFFIVFDEEKYPPSRLWQVNAETVGMSFTLPHPQLWDSTSISSYQVAVVEYGYAQISDLVFIEGLPDL